MDIEDPSDLLASLTRDITVRPRVPEQNRNNNMFQSFVCDLFEPFLLKQVGKRFQEAQPQPVNFVPEKQLMFQEEMVKSSNQ